MEIQDTSKLRQKITLIVICGYVLPVLLIYWQLVPFAWRFYLLIFAAVTIIAIARLDQFSGKELGFTTQNLQNSLRAIALPTLASAMMMVIYYTQNGSRINNSAYSWSFYLFFVFLSSPLQEFLYRGFLFGILTRAKLAVWLQILLSSFLYGLVHLIYKDIPTLLLTSLIGLFWGFHYAQYRNLYSIIISHSLLGAIAILVGLV